MNAPLKFVMVAVVFLMAAAVIAMKQDVAKPASDMARGAAAATDAPSPPARSVPLPHLVDLGAGKCVPCKLMEPILDQLRVDFRDQFRVTFIDVWENPDAGDAYGIRIIPTQIFFDADGNELFRHEGFYSREEILGKWRELGFTFESAPDMEAGS